MPSKWNKGLTGENTTFTARQICWWWSGNVAFRALLSKVPGQCEAGTHLFLFHLGGLGGISENAVFPGKGKLG